MCCDCYNAEQQHQPGLRKLANLRVEIANELAGLESCKNFTLPQTGDKSMAVNEKFVDEHVAYWNEENKLIQDMNMQELEARIDEWEKIYRKAKNCLSAD